MEVGWARADVFQGGHSPITHSGTGQVERELVSYFKVKVAGG